MSYYYVIWIINTVQKTIIVRQRIAQSQHSSQCSGIMQKDNTNIISTAGIEQIILPSKLY